MVTTLTVIMLIMSTTGNVSKQTTETLVKSAGQCIAAQDHIMQKKLPENIKLVSIICSTTGKI